MTSFFLVAGGVEFDIDSSCAGAVPGGLYPAFFFYPALTSGAILRRPFGTCYTCDALTRR